MATLSPSQKPDVEKAIASQTEIVYPKVAGGAENGSKNEFSADSRPQVWQDLENETGFSSYEAYISKYVEKWPQFRQFLATLRGVREDDELFKAKQVDPVPRRGYFYLYEVHQSGEISEKQSYRGTFSLEQASAILQFIRDASDTVISRLVFIEISGDEDLPACFFDALGLGLRLDPRTLMAFLRRKTFDRLSLLFGHSATTRRSVFESSPLAFRFMTEPQPLDPSFVGIGPFVLTYTNSLSLGKRLPPVLLIIGYPNTDQRHCVDLGLEISDTPVFTSNAIEEIERPWKWPLFMISLIKKHQKRRSIELDRTSFPLYWILAFGQVQAMYLKSYCRRCRSEYLRLTLCEGLLTTDRPEQDTRAHLHRQWSRLRRSIEDAHDGIHQFKRVISRTMGEKVHGESSIRDLYAGLNAILAEGARLETEIKDYLQLQVGNLALEESKKSIELSNAQIEEAKRVKIVTLIAFIYVPLNLGTSIFGMNIQQLNASGVSMPIFIYTVLGILGATIVCWFTITQHEGYHQWQSKTQRGKGSPVERHTSGYCLTARLTMLVWLLRKGHTSWLWATNAWIGLLTNDLVGSFKSEGPDTFTTRACDYVTRYYKDEHRGPGAFSTERRIVKL